MKKTLLFAFAILFATATMAQNRAVLLQESFDGTSMPTGWTISGQPNNWSVSGTNNAGGEPNEMHLTWSPQFNGMTRLVSPAVNLTGVNSVIFSFKHALDNYSGSNTIGIATSSDGGTTWNQGWSQGYSTSSSWSVSQEITTPDMGLANVQFCIFFNGSSYNINDWFFDDIMVFTLENLDLSLTNATLNDFVGSGEQQFGIGVFNMGASTVTSIEATYAVEGWVPVTETFDVNIPSLGTSTLNFTTPTTLAPGSYNVDYTINLVNGQEDDNADNNTLSKSVSVALGTAYRYPMIEHFSSSTCGPCVQPNTLMHTFCNNNEGLYTYTKYQMNWPGNGDPYYTEEGGVRRNYYSVNAVPMAFMDGTSLNFNGVQNQFNQHAEWPAFFDIAGSFAVEGNTISVKADIMPYVDANARVFISVNEKETHGNVGSNGETSFHHIFMKMLTSTSGENIDFATGEIQHFEYTQDLSSTNVEEMSDLEVAIWIQNQGSKEVYNSHYAYEYTEIHPYPVENLTLTEAPAPTKGLFVASWDAPANGNPIGYDVYVNNELMAENITETEYSFDGESGDFYTVGVVAKYESDMSSVKVMTTVSGALQDMGLMIPGSPYVYLTVEEPEADVYVTNGNYASYLPIEVTSITEVNPDGVEYLIIEPEMELPYSLDVDENLHFFVAPNTAMGRSVAETMVKVESDGGDVFFNVYIDGELLTITEVSSTAKVYPNPANSQVRVESANGIESVKVFDMLGTLVQTVAANGKSVNVNTNSLSNGVYFFNIRQSDGSVSNQRVVVNH
ncbi:MAG: T9SS type A sorting domain-containing protein [Bacteroidales bacterium]|nr:T9SS type A sorting domain-containing protein [Bacteroidales bacterium]